MIPVDEYHNLTRDIHSNSIINTDREAYLKAKTRKDMRIRQRAEYEEMKKQIQELIKRCDALECQVSELRGINN